MGLAHLVIDMDELGRRKRYADAGDPFGYGNPNQNQPQQLGSYYGTPQQAYQQGQQTGYSTGYGQGQASVNNQGTAHPTTWINNQGVAPINPNSYQYGGTPGGAAAQVGYLQGQNAGVQNEQAAQIQNQYDQRDQGNVQGTLGGLSSFYQGQLNGTGPSLAAEQAKAGMDQSVAAQMAAANSARGSLAGAAGQMAAANNAAGAQQAAAQQAVQGRIGEEYAAAQGMQGLGGLYEQEQGLNIGEAEQQAQLQQAQQELAARTGLGYAGLENQVNQEQLGAQMQEQAQKSQNYQAASGQGMQQGQFNTTQNWNEVMGGIGAGLGLVAAFADADFQEPSRIGRPTVPAKTTLGPRGYADGDMPAHLTLREEHSVDGNPFMLIADQNTHQLRKVATQPLTPAEHRQAMAPHGAGPIFGQADRVHTTMHDGGLGDPNIQAGLANLDWGNSGGGGGTFVDQLRAKEAADYAGAQPMTPAQQRFYGPAAQPAPQGISSDEAAQYFGGNGPSPIAANAGRAVATGGYDQGWDNVAKKPAAPVAAASDHKASDRTMQLALAMMQPHTATPYAAYPYADADLEDEHHLAHLYGVGRKGGAY